MQLRCRPAAVPRGEEVVHGRLQTDPWAGEAAQEPLLVANVDRQLLYVDLTDSEQRHVKRPTTRDERKYGVGVVLEVGYVRRAGERGGERDGRGAGGGAVVRE